MESLQCRNTYHHWAVMRCPGTSHPGTKNLGMRVCIYVKEFCLVCSKEQTGSVLDRKWILLWNHFSEIYHQKLIMADTVNKIKKLAVDYAVT